MVPVASIVGMTLTLLICLLLPLGGLVWIVTKRRGGVRVYPQAGRAFAAGMLTFVASQVLTRIPLMAWLSGQSAPWAQWLLSGPAASFTAGLFEETGRLLVMLWLLRRFHRWIDGVSFGLGHGGIEAVLLVGLTQLSNLTLAFLINSGQTAALDQLPAATRDMVLNALTGTPSLDFYLAGVERIAAIGLHVGLSVLILWGIVAGRRALAWVVAVLIHGVCNLAAVLLVTSGIPGANVIAEVVLLALVIAFWAVFVLRSRPRFPSEIQPAAR
ncbi:MAG: YhfC family glutamic-type intramembrane protease [Micropruina sp.]|uniref:YhfC family intramembrane metalloprotease n=1 Tax=Micropruina sp. TaxID=2737536 RepID=UPI0039E512CB